MITEMLIQEPPRRSKLMENGFQIVQEIHTCHCSCCNGNEPRLAVCLQWNYKVWNKFNSKYDKYFLWKFTDRSSFNLNAQSFHDRPTRYFFYTNHHFFVYPRIQQSKTSVVPNKKVFFRALLSNVQLWAAIKI